jgi:hypothetical protein
MTEAKKMIPTPDFYIINSPDPDISGSYYAMQRARQAAVDLAIQTNTAIITSVDGKVVRIPASELIKRSLNTKKLA